MLLKMGVDVGRLKREIRRKLDLIDNIFRRNGAGEGVITSTYEGGHSASSLHYADMAIDLRNDGMNWAKQRQILNDLELSLGGDFDCIIEGNHFHIEYDPKE